MKTLFRLCVVLLPWALRRHLLCVVYGYEIHPTARIGLSWVFPEKLIMAEGATIGHLNVALRLHRVELAAHALIHRNNWITGVSRDDPRHFRHRVDRDPALVMGPHSAITKSHHIDCCDRIEIGAFATIGGYQSQFLTHAIDFEHNRQDAAPIRIGDYAFVGTNVVILGGAVLPARSVLGAKALLNKTLGEPGWLYGGVPAAPIRRLPECAAYFHRTTGFVE